MKDLKEATAVLKDLAGVAKTLNDQGAQAEGGRVRRGAAADGGGRTMSIVQSKSAGGLAAPAAAGRNL